MNPTKNLTPAQVLAKLWREAPAASFPVPFVSVDAYLANKHDLPWEA